MCKSRDRALVTRALFITVVMTVGLVLRPATGPRTQAQPGPQT